MTGPLRKPYGFTMLPMILVLFFIVAIISGAILMAGPKAANQRMADTTTTLNSCAATIMTCSAATRTLPTTLTPVFTTPPRDSWGDGIHYLYDVNLTTPAGGGVCGRRSTNLTVNGTANVAFALFSGGGDGLQSTWSGMPAFSTGVLAYSASAAGITATLATGTPGDLYRIVTLDELQSRAGCFGSTAGRLKILNNELPNACSGGSSYAANLYGEGGVPGVAGYIWAKVSGPSWIAVNATTGAMTPTGTITATTGIYPLTVSLTDSHTPTATTILKNYNLQVISCGGGTINFSNLAGDYTTVDGSGTNIVVNPASGTVNLGNNQYNGTNGYGCLWYKNNLSLAGRTFRGYFDVRTNIDYSGASTTQGDGFTFTVMQSANPYTVCGGAGEALGYGSRDGHYIPGDSFAVEFDTYPNGGENDPGNYNHVAVVKGSTVLHNGGGSATLGPNPTCTGASHPGCYYRTPISWLEDGAIHRMRIEIATQCDATCGACGPATPSGSYALIKAWVDCGDAACSALTANYTGAIPSLTHCMALPASLTNVKIGFTEATWGATQSTILSNFNAGFF